MLNRCHRLTSSQLFGDTVRRGRRAGTRTLVVHLATASTPESKGSDTGPQVGLVVSKAVGQAVTRNLVKRRLRHLARERLRSLPGSAVLVVRALPASAQASYAALGRDLDVALARATAGSGAAR